MGYELGVDLGGTAVAAAVATDSRVELVHLGDGAVDAPAVVFLDDDGSLIAGEAAARLAVEHPDRVGRELIRRLGSPAPVRLGDTAHPPSTLLGVAPAGRRRRVAETHGIQAGPGGAHPPGALVPRPPRRVHRGDPQRRAARGRGRSPSRRRWSRTTRRPAASPKGTPSRCTTWAAAPSTPPCCAAPRPASSCSGRPEGIERLGGGTFDEAILSHVNQAADGPLTGLDRRDPEHAAAVAGLRQALRCWPRRRCRPRHDRHHPGAAAQPAGRGDADPGRVRAADPHLDRDDDRCAAEGVAVGRGRAARAGRGAAGRRLEPDPAGGQDDHRRAGPADRAGPRSEAPGRARSRDPGRRGRRHRDPAPRLAGPATGRNPLDRGTPGRHGRNGDRRTAAPRADGRRNGHRQSPPEAEPLLDPGTPASTVPVRPGPGAGGAGAGRGRHPARRPRHVRRPAAGRRHTRSPCRAVRAPRPGRLRSGSSRPAPLPGAPWPPRAPRPRIARRRVSWPARPPSSPRPPRPRRRARPRRRPAARAPRRAGAPRPGRQRSGRSPAACAGGGPGGPTGRRRRRLAVLLARGPGRRAGRGRLPRLGAGLDRPRGRPHGAGRPGRPPAPAAASVPSPAVGATVPVGETPGFVVVSPDGRRALVANQAAGVVTVVDTATNEVTATIPVPPARRSTCPSPPTGAASTSASGTRPAPSPRSACWTRRPTDSWPPSRCAPGRTCPRSPRTDSGSTCPTTTPAPSR